MAFAAFRVVSYALCFNSVLIAFADNDLVADWRHLFSGLPEFSSSVNDDWTKDVSHLLETNYKILADANHDAVTPQDATLTTGDSKLDSSEERKRTKDNKEFKKKHNVLHHFFPVLETNLTVIGPTDLSSQKPDHTPTLLLKNSSDHNGEEKVKSEYGILTILLPFRIEKYAEKNGIPNHDNGGTSAALDDDQGMEERGLELKKEKFKSFRRKRNVSNDESETMESRLLSADNEDEDEKSVSDESEKWSSPEKKEKRDTGSLSVEITTPNPKANVSNNLNYTSGRSENNTDDSNKIAISRNLDMQATTSLPPCTTTKNGSRECGNKHEEPREATELSVKYLGETTDGTDGPMRVEDDFAYITDTPEIHLSGDRDTVSGEIVSDPGKIITLHWTLRFEPEDSSSASGEHPHPPADDGRDVFEQNVYVDQDGSPGHGHTSNFPEHTRVEGDSSDYLDQLPLPSGAAQEFPYKQSARPSSVGEYPSTDQVIVPVVESLYPPPISEALQHELESQSGVVLPEDELTDGLVDMESEHGMPFVDTSEKEPLHPDTSYLPSLEESVEMEPGLPASFAVTSVEEPFDADTMYIPSSLGEPVEMEPGLPVSFPDASVEEPLDPDTTYIPSLLEEPVEMEPGIPVSFADASVEEPLDPDTLYIPSSVDEPVDMVPGLSVSFTDAPEEVLFDPDTLSHTQSLLDEIIGTEPVLPVSFIDALEEEPFDPDAFYIPPSLGEPVDIGPVLPLPFIGAFVEEPFAPDTLHIPSSLGEPVDLGPVLPLSLKDAAGEEIFVPDTLSHIPSSLDEPVDIESGLPVSLVDLLAGLPFRNPSSLEKQSTIINDDNGQGAELQQIIDESTGGQFDPAAMSLEYLPAYGETGLESYVEKDHRDLIDSAQGAPCRCNEVVARNFNDRP
ncbi:uncharacterized protein LOC126336140 isoform X2 [Schistocerca gregaria]|uniref:uncharacterized protein LOC126336140 isoform X2 n=1 Tax=Schistocerca gregaria TaxID=7010 RepID=UPI00211EECBF|nr:uncharacterized protein LOC126336140 isoform X2 [Schistocerca gregaria]